MKIRSLEDENLPRNLQNFVTELHDALKDYEHAFTNANDWTKQDHTFAEWLAHFGRFMSW
jgi:hypothetical protein